MARSQGADLALLLLGGFHAMTDEVVAELARRGHPDVRPVHEFALRAIDAGADTASELGRRARRSPSRRPPRRSPPCNASATSSSKPTRPTDAAERIRVTPRGRDMVALGGALFDDVRERWASESALEQLDALQAAPRPARDRQAARCPGPRPRPRYLRRVAHGTDNGPGFCQTFPRACRRLGGGVDLVCGMSLRTPLVLAVALLSALAGVAVAAVALPSSPPRPVRAAASASPEIQTQTIRRTIHVVRRDASASATTAASGSTDDSTRGSGRSARRRRGPPPQPQRRRRLVARTRPEQRRRSRPPPRPGPRRRAGPRLGPRPRAWPRRRLEPSPGPRPRRCHGPCLGPRSRARRRRGPPPRARLQRRRCRPGPRPRAWGRR